MHDIICPNCGDRFLASDVAFDLSQFIIPLLHEKPEEADEVKAVRFKFLVDEDSIINSTEPDNTIPLEWETRGGPNPLDPHYPYVVTSDAIFNYICNKLGRKRQEIEDMFEELKNANEKTTRGEYRCTPTQLNVIREMYFVFFGVSENTVGDIDLDDDNVKVAIRVLLHIFNNRYTASSKVVLRVRCYSANKNGYHVPDILFVQGGGMTPVRIEKCCRFCGRKLPDEFGYYKMMPAVLLGSHFAGKTSYLLALYYMVLKMPPFTTEDSIKAYPLTNDDNLTAFQRNLERYRKGEPPEKTDFYDIPILNLRIDDVIYSFIDWPGEKFIDDKYEIDRDFIYNTKKVITHARHVLFFLEPSQIDASLASKEENVDFDMDNLISRLRWHLDFPNPDKLRSILFVVNKIDMIANNEYTESYYRDIRAIPETDFFGNGKWHDEAFSSLEKKIKSYISELKPSLLYGLENIETKDKVERLFVPVAPYGASDNKEQGMVIHRGCLVGVPLLKILKTDSTLK